MFYVLQQKSFIWEKNIFLHKQRVDVTEQRLMTGTGNDVIHVLLCQKEKGKCLFLSLCLPQYYAHVSVFHLDKFTFIYFLSFLWHLAATLPPNSPANPYSTHIDLQRSFRITTFTSLPTPALASASAWAPALCT